MMLECPSYHRHLLVEIRCGMGQQVSAGIVDETG